MTFDQNGGVYEICGHRVRLTPPGSAEAWSVRGTADGVAIRIPLTVLPQGAGDEPMGGGIDILTSCTGQAQSVWVKGAALQLQWRHVKPRPELGLTEYRTRADMPNVRDIVFAADASYLKPDGSPFVMQCDSNDDITPIACRVEYELAPGLNVSYRYYTAGALPRWQEIDQLVRATINKE